MHESKLRKNKGFTLVEILVVLAIMAVFTFSAPKMLNSFNKYSLDSNYNELIQTLRSAVIKSMSGNAGSGWGVHLVSGAGGSFTLFKGAVYSADDTDNEVHTLNASLTLSASSTDIIFSKIEATTTNTGTITLSWPDGSLSKAVSVNAFGTLTKL